MEGAPTPPESLVQYEGPLLVEGTAPHMDSKPGATGLESKGPTTQLDEILNSILPPRTWVDSSAKWMQYVSKAPSTRLDVINLQEQLDTKLMERQARESGICPVREDLYAQCFDELIRQVTINGPERGLLLLRVRDEIRMTIDAYKTLYDSSVTFGIRKQLQAEQGMSELEDRIGTLDTRKRDLENRVVELRHKVEVIEKRENERRLLDEKRRKEELEFLKYQGQHFDQFLKSIGGSGK